MKPKNSIQRRIVELNDLLPDITESKKKWATENIPEHNIIYNERTGRAWCTACGKSWKDKHLAAGALNTKPQKTVCPYCHKKHSVTTCGQLTYFDTRYYTVIERFREWQVVRNFLIKMRCKIDRKAIVFSKEVMRVWYDGKGHKEITSLFCGGLSFYYDQWTMGDYLELCNIKREGHNAYLRHRIYGDIYPHSNLLPVFKRNGLTSNFHGVSPYYIMEHIITNCYVETLWKAKYYKMAEHIIKNCNMTLPLWSALKICIRNGYKITNADTYSDYIDLLAYFKKDFRNAMYACPPKLQREHDRLSEKKADIMERERLEAREKEELNKLKKARTADKKYLKDHAKYLKILIENKHFVVYPLQNIEEFYKEGIAMHHCVFSNEYYNRKDSLILSARRKDNNERIETIEVSLKRKEVVQAYGKDNLTTAEHNSLVKLVNRKIPKLIAPCA